jgi:hypothetical protein
MAGLLLSRDWGLRTGGIFVSTLSLYFVSSYFTAANRFADNKYTNRLFTPCLAPSHGMRMVRSFIFCSAASTGAINNADRIGRVFGLEVSVFCIRVCCTTLDS